MNYKSFVDLLKKIFEEFLSEDIIANSDGEDLLYGAEWTYLFHIVLYITVRKYNKSHSQKLKIIPEKGGRVPIDFSLIYDDKKCFLLIEHENSEKKIRSNFEKLTDPKNNAAEHYLLISYVKDKKTGKIIIENLKQKKKELCSNRQIHILFGPDTDELSEEESFFIIDEII
jgi:hypothetical protein